MPSVKLYLFGSPRIEVDDQSIELSLRKGHGLLAYLAVTAQPHSRDALATLFWPESNQKRARTNLRQMLYSVGQQVGNWFLNATPETVSLEPTLDIWVDVQVFEQLAHEGLSQPAQVESLLAAVNLYTSDFMAGFNLDDCPEYDEWQFFRRVELEKILAQALQRLADHGEERKEYEEAVPYIRRWVALDPLHEPAQRRLIEIYALAGQPTVAIRQYHECLRILDAELGVPPEAETTALFDAIRTRKFPVIPSEQAESKLVGGIPPAKRNAYPESNLPIQTTPFIGRTKECRDVVRRITDPACRLLTLMGPGGIGKTRLAIEIAQTLIERPDDANIFRDGVYFASLQPVENPADIVSALTDAIGLHLHNDVPAKQQLINYLQGRKLLLLLDNFEHLLTGVELIIELLTQASSVKFLVTSREVLKVRDEWFHPITGLPFPDPQETSVELVDRYESVQLFVRIAERTQVDFSLERDREHVVRICQLVEGMPLAIELAASWLHIFSCAQIAEEIARNIDILTVQYRDIPERHRSMRAVLEQTWQLLSTPNKEILMRLSVCRGGFQQEAAAAIADATLPSLANLIDRSVISSTTENRFYMHELLRHFAAEELNQTDKLLHVDASRRHCEFYLKQISTLESALAGSEQVAAIEAFGKEFDNVQAAWQWAISHGALHLIEQSINSLYYYYWFRRGREGVNVFAEALQKLQKQMPEADAESLGSVEINLLRKLGLFHYTYASDYATARHYLDASLKIARRFNRPIDEANSLNALGTLAGWQGKLVEAREQLEESLRLARSEDNQATMADSLQQLAQFANSAGDYAKAQNLAEESLNLCRRLQRHDWSAYALSYLGATAFYMGNYNKASRYYHESHSIFTDLDHRRGLAGTFAGLGRMAWQRDGKQVSQARDYFAKGLTIAREQNSPFHATNLLADLAQVECDQGNYAQAYDYGIEGLQLSEELGLQIAVVQNLYALASIDTAKGMYTDAKGYLTRALKLTADNDLFPYSMMGLYRFANLLYLENRGSGLAVHNGANVQTRITQLLTIVVHHRTTWHLYRQKANQLRQQLDMIRPDALPQKPNSMPTDLSLRKMVMEITGID